MNSINNSKTSGFLGLALRQKLLQRWPLMRCVEQENVLEHTAVVSLLTLIVGNLARQNGKKVNIEKMQGYAILHDLNETLTQDYFPP